MTGRIALLDVLADKAPEQFDHSHLRTLQCRVKRWRAKEKIKEKTKEKIVVINMY